MAESGEKETKKENVGNVDKINLLIRDKTKIPVIDDFNIVKPISRGSFGKVFLGYKKTNQQQMYAIKVMKKSEMIHKNMASQVVTERNALALSNSPFCVQLFYSLQSTNNIYLVMEYMVGGDLKSLLSYYGYFDEPWSIFYTAEIILALEYLHSHGITHRDLKPDNMLLSHQGHVKLTDFGLSRIEIHRDLEISDLVDTQSQFDQNENYSRTPGQLLSLTSHLSFGSGKNTPLEMKDSPITSVASSAEIPCRDLSQVLKDKTNVSAFSVCSDNISSFNETRISGIHPFSSAEINQDWFKESSDTSRDSEDASSSGTSTYFSCKEELDSTNCTENIISPVGRASTMSQIGFIQNHSTSPRSRTGKNNTVFKFPSLNSRGLKRKRTFGEVLDSGCSELSTPRSTGLTQDLSDLVFRTSPQSSPKRPHLESCPEEELIMPNLRSVLKNSMSPPTSDEANSKELVSTPLSSMKESTLADELPINVAVKTTRFHLPKSHEKKKYDSDTSLSSLAHSSIATTPANATPKTSSHTPFRTPKSVRRGAAPPPRSSDQRILGTPDYLAPELLLKQGHGPSVDWWALGVCLFEFMTGLPPFNDETPQAVFNNILNRDIPWPEGEEQLSEEAQQAINSLLTLDPAQRPAASQVRSMALFKDILWDELLDQQAPFVPQPDDLTDTCYFQARNIMQSLQVSNFEL